ncbi:MAG: hypothetical protein R3Y06_06685 [Faecalibacterium sp.]
MKHPLKQHLTLIKNVLHIAHTKTLHSICSGVSESENEVAGRIRFLAKFKQPKALALGAIGLALACVAVFCLGGDNPIVTLPQSASTATASSAVSDASQTNEENNTASGTENASSETDTAGMLSLATTRDDYFIWQADLNHDGQDESILLDTAALKQSGEQYLYVQEAGETALPTEVTLWRSPLDSTIDTEQYRAYYLYHDTAGDYLLYYHQSWNPDYNTGSYYFELFYLAETGAKTLQDYGECTIYACALQEEHFGVANSAENDIEEIVAFYETLTHYIDNSYVLVNTLIDTTGPSEDGTEVTGGYSIGTPQNPVSLVPNLINENIFPEDADISPLGSASDYLRAQLTYINAVAAESNQAWRDAYALANEEAMAEIGMTAPFTALPTYYLKVAEDYGTQPAEQYGGSLYMSQAGSTRSDGLGNQISYSLSVRTPQDAVATDAYNTRLLLCEVYWNGLYVGDAPNSIDSSYHDFYYYDGYMLMLEMAYYLPESSNLQLTVDSSAESNGKEIATVSCAVHSPNGTVLEVITLDNTTATDGTVTLEIPALDYHGEEKVVLQFIIDLTDDAGAEDRLTFALPCRAAE